MAIDKMVGPLLRVPILSGLRPLQLTEIARRAERIVFRSGSIITHAGAEGDGAYLIVSGVAERLPDANSSEPAEPIEPGSLVGEMAMLVEHIFRATVVARGRVNCLKIARTTLYEQMEQDPRLADHFTTMLASRLRNVAAEMRQIDELLAHQCGGENAPSAPLALTSAVFPDTPRAG